jgi:dsRNA-specific ribonuclease
VTLTFTPLTMPHSFTTKTSIYEAAVSKRLPELPFINDSQIRTHVFTPPSLSPRVRVLDYARDEPIEATQRLELLGDAVIHVCITLVLEDLCPNLGAGSISRLRAELESNRLLIIISKDYDLAREMKCANPMDLSGDKVHGKHIHLR